jgi:hypothetical protein
VAKVWEPMKAARPLVNPSPVRPRRAWRGCFLLIGGLALLAALWAAWWLTRPITTGVGELTRLEVGGTYFKLARQMPGYCQQGYVVGILGAVGSSVAIAADKAHDVPWIVTPPEEEGEIAWLAVPGEAWRLFGESLDGLFHDPRHRCPLPRPADWSPGATGTTSLLLVGQAALDAAARAE